MHQGRIHIIDSTRRRCARCGALLPPGIAGRSDLPPATGVAQDRSNPDMYRIFVPSGDHGSYVVCAGSGPPAFTRGQVPQRGSSS